MADSKDPAVKDASSATTTGGLRSDTYGKDTTKTGTDVATDPMADPNLNQFADLKPGDSKLVAEGGSEPEVPGVPVKGSDEARDRREAGIPEPPKPALYTDLHATSGGYQVTPAGVTPEELHDYQKDNTRQ